jgi:hypothetical protein
VLRLDAADFAAAKRDPFLAERMKRALQAAGTRATEAVASVDFAAALLSWGSMGVLGPIEARLFGRSRAMGATVVPVARGSEDGRGDARGGTGRRAAGGRGGRGATATRGRSTRGISRVRVRRAAQVRWVVIAAAAIEDEAGAKEAASAACEGMAFVHVFFSNRGRLW